MRTLATISLLILAAGLATVACESRTLPTETVIETCGPYPPIATSAYVLPYEVGTSAHISQGNCGQYTHSGSIKYAVDFSLAVGRPVLAARGGRVTAVRAHFRDGIDLNLGQSNYIDVQHDDGTVAVYIHLMQDSLRVQVGDTVAQGQMIALAGNTGFTGNWPHLHFAVYGCMEGCESVAVVFRNADPPAPDGLRRDGIYTALPH
jgi:murein DD-endopeptidase MepM/ murein hydrolase activator NlpD